MKNNFLAHVADRVLNRPLLILPEKLSMIAQIIDGRIGIDAAGLPKVDAETGDALIPKTEVGAFAFEKDANGRRKIFRQTESGTAVIPVIGSLVNRGDFFDALSGVESYQSIKQKLAAAAADDSINSIVLEIDSPGGEAIGAFEVGDAVAAAARLKPVIAHANGLCCSAAYAIAAGADHVVASPSALIGSIGVVLLHLDHSAAIHNAGIKPTLIHAGARKVDGNPYQALTEDVAASLKSEVETFMDLFVTSVARGRAGLSTDAIRATEARTYIGAKAVEVGLADSVGSFESVIAEFSRAGRSGRTKIGAKAMSDKTTETVSLADHNAAVAAARTEGHSAGLAEGKSIGANAERDRFKAVAGGEHYKGREAAAHHALLTTEMSAEGISGLLAALPTSTSAALPAGRSKDTSTGLVDAGPDAGGGATKVLTEVEKGQEMARAAGIGK